MINTNKISEKWIKASIIGTIWAASEIVLGSFLHNLSIPFSGNILAAIGIIILISVSYIWNEKGLFWRAGVICAVMKTLSPSAVIFGPMIAILCESLLLELTTRLFGKTILGFVTGAMLAISWNLFQKILNFILFYGFNIVELYKDLIKLAQKQLNIQSDILWMPIFILLLIYSVIGFLTAIVGIRVGRKMLENPHLYHSITELNKTETQPAETKPEFNYSLLWLFADIAFIVLSLFLLNFYSWIFWSFPIIIIVTIWSIRYKRALRQLSKPKFWTFFVIITMITTLIFTRFQSGVDGWEQGLIIGLQMNFRAVIIILGFSVLGTELYNPVIRNFFLRTYFKQLPLALELSFESLPSMIANMPDFKTIVKNPVAVICQITSQAEFRLAEIKKKLPPNVSVLTGGKGEGKTTYLTKIIEKFKAQSISVGGIFSPRVIENNITIGYDVVDIMSNNRERFLRISDNNNLEKIGRYRILPEGLKMGSRALLSKNNRLNKFVIIDEVGALELQGHGWAGNLNELMKVSNCHLLLTVREGFIDQVIQKWNINREDVYNISEFDHHAICEMILEKNSPVS